MKKNVIFWVLCLMAGTFSLTAQEKINTGNMENKPSFYDFTAVSIDGDEISMSDYRDKVVLVVNTASECGFTPQYEGLEKLHQKYADKGLVILGFPCNQFGGQEPGSEKEIASFCRLNYGVTFQMFSKIDVNGEDAHPLYKFLKSEKGGMLGSRIKWNFTKFLIDRNGKVVDRFGSTSTPESIEGKIDRLL